MSLKARTLRSWRNTAQFESPHTLCGHMYAFDEISSVEKLCVPVEARSNYLKVAGRDFAGVIKFPVLVL